MSITDPTLKEIKEVTESQTVQSTPPATAKEPDQALRNSVEMVLKNYLASTDGRPVTGVYQRVLADVEAPFLKVVMKYVKNNQTKAAIMLGLNRGTLRKKLKQYNLL